MSETNKDTSYITFVAVVSAWAVLTLHTNNCFWHFTGKESYWFSANIIESVFYFAVPLFFMITGVTLMDFFDRDSLNGYFLKRIKRTFIPFIAWSLIAVAIDLYTGKRLITNITFRSLYQDITGTRIVGIFGFFRSLFPLYLCIPLYASVDKSKRKLVFSYLVLMGFVFNVFFPFLKKVFSSDLNTFLYVPVVSGYLIWPLIGWLLHNVELKKWQKEIVYASALFGLALHIGGTYVLSTEVNHIVGTYKGYESVPSMLYATGVFLFLKDAGTWLMQRKMAEKIVKFLGRFILEFYIMQFILLDIAKTSSYVEKTSMVYRLGGPFVMMVIIIIATWILRKIPIIKRIVP